MPIVTETHQEWMERNGYDGANDVRAFDRPSELLLPTGAVVRQLTNGQRVYTEAPPDDRPLDVLKARIRYQRSLLARETNKFNTLRASLRQQAQFNRVAPMNCPPPNPAGIQALRTMSAKVRELRKALDALREQVPYLPELAGRAAVRAEQTRREALQQADAERTAAEIDSINL